MAYMEKTTFILVDDDPTSNLISEFNIRKVLKQAEVKVFGSADKALSYIMAQRSHLCERTTFLLTDLNMPGMDGRELLRRLVQWDSAIGEILRIYVLSAGEEDLGNDSVSSPVVRANLLKPLKIADIQDLIGL